MSNENLMIEVVGSSNKAVNALDKVISKLNELQNKFILANRDVLCTCYFILRLFLIKVMNISI